MTLLALDLPAPEGESNAEAPHSLVKHADEYRAFLISFLVVGVHWFAHHRIFGYLSGLGGWLARWNMLWLLTIVLMLFATRTLTGDGAFQVRFSYARAFAISGAFLVSIAVAFLTRWAYVCWVVVPFRDTRRPVARAPPRGRPPLLRSARSATTTAVGHGVRQPRPSSAWKRLANRYASPGQRADR
jgi:uncharacterized membrane protein